MIIEEIADHMLFWHSDRCKRETVERHLSMPSRETHKGRKPMEKVTEKIDALIQQKKVIRIRTHTGDYLKLPQNK